MTDDHLLLCKDCKHLKTVKVGHVSSRSWCSLSGRDGQAIGVNPWLQKPHPKCQLRKDAKHMVCAENTEGEAK